MTKKWILGLLLAKSAWAAPLFPAADETHWAADAVAKLRGAGMLTGYSDGTLKGDRASSRFEVALLVARLLQWAEQEQGKLAGREQLKLLEALARELRDELAALGVRVQATEEKVTLLDERVTELERLTFYGSVETRLTAQAFSNYGNSDNDNRRGGTGAPGVGFLDYNRQVGSSLGPVLRPQVQGVVPVVDYRNGRALLNGVGFTSVARLGLKALIDKDNEAGLELAAFTAQGNTFVDSYWGVSAPYLASPWTANPALGAGEANTPFSRAVFNHAYYLHKPSQTRLRLGAIDTLRIDPFVYTGAPNLNAFGPARFPAFGAQLWAQWKPAEDQELQLEIFGGDFGESGNLFQNTNYQHVVWGGDLSYRWGAADCKVSFARIYDESPGFSEGLTGIAATTNVNYLNSTGWSQIQWVNPPGHFALQRQDAEIAATTPVNGIYAPNLADTRPVPGWNGASDGARGITSGGGNFGPQSQDTLGVSAHYWVPLGEESGKDGFKFTGEFGHSTYQPNWHSSYSVGGNMVRGELAATLDGERLKLSLEGLRVDPSYNPAIFIGGLLGIRFVRPFNFFGRFHLHDSVKYQQNREGFALRGQYRFEDPDLTLNFKAASYQQTRSSLYDVRVPGSSFGPQIPTNAVLGFAPGFIDTVFAGFAHPNLYGARSGNSFDAALNPLENPRGSAQEFGLNLRYKLPEPALTFDLAYERNLWRRTTQLDPSLGGSQNRVDLQSDYALFGVSWDASENWTLRSGVERIRLAGHHDPGGLYNGFALRSGRTDFTNIDTVQTIPYLGFDHKLTKNSLWSLDFRYYQTRDQVDSSIFAGAGENAIGFTEHPFNWSGLQVSSYYKLTF